MIKQRFKKIFLLSKDEIIKYFGKEFYHYFRRDFKKENFFEKCLEEYKNIAKLIHLKNKTILDIGCGFGLSSNFLKLLEAKSIYGLDYNKEKILGLKKLLIFLNLQNDKSIKVIHGDILTHNFKNIKFDVVLTIEFISHVRDLDLLFKKISSILKPGGVFYIKDYRNLLCPKQFFATRKIWKITEFGNKNELKNLNQKKNFYQIRKEIIKKNFSQISDQKINSLAKKTKGLTESEIIRAINSHLKTGRKVKSKKYCRHPITGEFQERLLNPFKLMNSLQKYGFHTLLLYPQRWNIAKNKKDQILNNLKKMLWPSLIFRQRYFEILARLK